MQDQVPDQSAISSAASTRPRPEDQAIEDGATKEAAEVEAPPPALTLLTLQVDNRIQVQVCLHVICRTWSLTEVPYVVASLKEFLGLPPRTIADVSKSSDLVTLRRVIALDQFEPADSILTCAGFRRWQFNEAMKNAVVADNLEMAKVLLESFPDLKASFDAVNLAASNGRADILALLFSRNATTVAPIEPGAGEDAANDGAHAEFGKSYDLIRSALEHGHLELAQWLVPRVNKVASATWIRAAVKGGSLQAVQWVYNLQPRCDGISSGAIDAAVKVGIVEMVRWLLERFQGFVDMARVVRCGHYDTIEWLLSVRPSRCFGLGMAVVVAAGRGRLDIVRLLLRHKPKNGASGAMDAAAGHGYLDLVRCLHANTSESCTAAVMDAAAANGHLEMVKWLHAHRTEGGTREAMDSAAVSGHLEVVERLHANRVAGCTTQAVDGAAKNGYIDVKWLLQNRSEGCSPRAINSAAAGGHLEIVQWLTNYGKTCTTDAMDVAACNGHLHVVKWLHANRSEGCTTQAMDEAAKNGRLDIVQWLHRNRSEGCSGVAINLATRFGHLNVVRWLHTNLAPTNVGTAALVSALELSHFSVVVYASMECSADLLKALSKVPQSRLEFLDWMYSRYPSEFVTAFLERFQPKEDWAKLCSRPRVQNWQFLNRPAALRRVRLPPIVVQDIAPQHRLLLEGGRRRRQELFALILGGRR